MSFKKNVLYSGFLTTSLYIFQFITYPYVARVLGVTNIGVCNYVQSIVTYFSLFCMLGISSLGVREIAKCKDDKRQLNETFSRLFALNAIFTLIVTGIYIIAIEFVPQFAAYRKLLYIGVVHLIFNLFIVEWLFRGLEDFRFITIRTLFVRVGYVVSIFLFVRKQDDYILFYSISVGMIVANAIINWAYSRKFVKFKFQQLKTLRPFVKPMFLLGAQLMLTSVYTTFNVVYLGFVAGDTEVGFYTTATKIENIILSLYTSFTLVMMPRISRLLESGNKEQVNNLLQKSMLLLFAFAFPCIAISEVFTEQIVYLVAGAGYEGAVLPMRIVMPVMLIVGMEQILIVQILLPGRNDKEVFANSILGAVTGLLLNVILVGAFRSVGSSFVWMIAELAVLVSAIYYVRKRHPYITFPKKMISHILYFIPFIVAMLFFKDLDLSFWVSFVVGGLIIALYSHIALRYMIRNDVYIELCNIVKNKMPF